MRLHPRSFFLCRVVMCMPTSPSHPRGTERPRPQQGLSVTTPRRSNPRTGEEWKASGRESAAAHFTRSFSHRALRRSLTATQAKPRGPWRPTWACQTLATASGLTVGRYSRGNEKKKTQPPRPRGMGRTPALGSGSPVAATQKQNTDGPSVDGGLWTGVHGRHPSADPTSSDIHCDATQSKCGPGAKREQAKPWPQRAGGRWGRTHNGKISTTHHEQAKPQPQRAGNGGATLKKRSEINNC